ncbi:MAG: IscS subfamily cysteine desulfurase [Candidatus Omnitrophica bacterium]|nr:IscS subfamily cysteine desulfurase [Candidatus Omnitrophota bacterium]
MEPIYYDYNATTPVAPQVLEAMLPFLKGNYANPSSSHHLARDAKRVIREARRSVAGLLNLADEAQIVFTSGGTESNNAAIRSALFHTGKKKIITSQVEHSSVLRLCQRLEEEGCEVIRLGVNGQGQIDIEELKQAICENTAIVSLMMANNETGVLFPVAQIGQFLREHGILFHVDAVQAITKEEINLETLCADYLSLSAHKFYGPKGIGALFVRREAPYRSLIFGGSQERGRRAGTENVPGIAGLGAATDLALSDFQQEREKMTALRDHFETQIKNRIEEIEIPGQASPRLANTSSILFKGILSESLLCCLDSKGICASSGSACMSGSQQPSHVLKAMGYSHEEAMSAVRFSFGRYTTHEEIDHSLEIISETVAELRRVNRSGTESKETFSEV